MSFLTFCISVSFHLLSFYIFFFRLSFLIPFQFLEKVLLAYSFGGKNLFIKRRHNDSLLSSIRFAQCVASFRPTDEQEEEQDSDYHKAWHN